MSHPHAVGIGGLLGFAEESEVDGAVGPVLEEVGMRGVVAIFAVFYYYESVGAASRGVENALWHLVEAFHVVGRVGKYEVGYRAGGCDEFEGVAAYETEFGAVELLTRFVDEASLSDGHFNGGDRGCTARYHFE